LEQNTNQEIVTKVNIWLDAKKPENKQGHAANIEMLKSKLDFSQLRLEESSLSEKIIVIPVNEQFKTGKTSIDPKAIINLVLILDASGKIRKGNIVLFIPEDTRVKRVPNNTFHAILNTAKPNCDGKFRYLSVAGQTLHELEYKDGRLKSFGKIQDLHESSLVNKGENSAIRTNTMCVDWYWVYTVYDEWGDVVQQWQEYFGTTCQGEDCYDPYLAMVCPMTTGGGGSDIEEFEVVKDKTAELTWTVQSNLGGGKVKEKSRIVGRFYRRNPQNDHLLGLAHSNVWLENSSWGTMGYITWSNTVHTGTLTSTTTITLNSSGRMTFLNNTYFDYSGSNPNIGIGDLWWP
jgi:hypothetical protein